MEVQRCQEPYKYLFALKDNEHRECLFSKIKLKIMQQFFKYNSEGLKVLKFG